MAALKTGNDVSLADNLHLPYQSDSFDAVISIGVIHHLTNVERRIAAIRELARILRPGGKLMIYVWALEQRLRKFDAQDVLIPWRLPPGKRRVRSSASSTSGDEEEEKSLRRNRALSERCSSETTIKTLRPLQAGTGACSQDSGICIKPAQKPPSTPTIHRIRTSGFWSLRNSRGDSTESSNGGDENRSSSLPNLVKTKLVGWFSKLSQDEEQPQPVKQISDKSALQDLAYKRLMEKVLEQDPFVLDPHKAMIENYKKAVKQSGFDVRHFPRSSTGMPGQRTHKKSLQRHLSTSDPADLTSRAAELEASAKRFEKIPPRLVRQKSLEGTPNCSRETSLDGGDDSVFINASWQETTKNAIVSMETAVKRPTGPQISPPPPIRPARFPSTDRWQQKLRMKKLVRSSTGSSTESEDSAVDYQRENRERRHVHKADSLPVESMNKSPRPRSQSDSEAADTSDAALSRYYHVFRKGELNALIEDKIKNLHIISTKYDHGNWCLVAEKVRIWTF